MYGLFLQQINKVKPTFNLIEVHPWLGWNNTHVSISVG